MNAYGCTLLLAGCIVLVFSVLLFKAGPRGFPTGQALAGGLIGAFAGSALGLAAWLFGIRGWRQASAVGASPALGIAGVAASFAGLVMFLIASICVLILLFSFVSNPGAFG
jgi:hypothetical protein